MRTHHSGGAITAELVNLWDERTEVMLLLKALDISPQELLEADALGL